MTTASSLPRVMACPTSAVLPQNDVQSPWGERGSAIHKFRELTGKGASVADALDQVPEEWRADCEALVLDDLPEGAGYEVAFAYDVVTGKARHLEGCKDRGYDAFAPASTEICGTADVVYVEPGEVDGSRRVVVIDYKTAAGKHEDPHTSAAMMFYGLCAWLVHQATEVRLIYRNTDYGRDYVSNVDMFDLLDFADKLRKLEGRVESAQSDHAVGAHLAATEGDHCRYCPAQESCPAKLQLKRYMTDPDGLEREIELAWAGGLNRENAADAYRTWQAMKQLTARAGDILHAYAKEHTIELGDGRAFGTVEKRGNELLDGDVVHAVLSGMYGVAVADAAIKRSAPHRLVKAAVKAIAEKGKYAGMEREVYAAIRKRGGGKRTPSTGVKEYKLRLADEATS